MNRKIITYDQATEMQNIKVTCKAATATYKKILVE